MGQVKKRVELSHKIQKRIHDLGSLVPLFEVPYFRIGYWGYIKFSGEKNNESSSGIDYFNLSNGGLIWIDKAAKKKVKERC